MAHLQSQFSRFDQAIKLRYHGQSSELREKRDRVLTRLRNNLQMSFDYFNQGSYDMGTGIEPADGDYDIDVGVVLNVSPNSTDPITAKTWVYNAVQGHTTDVRFRRNCITVYYQQYGEPKFHVDLAVYTRDAYDRIHLSVGKQGSALSERKWQEVDPRRLLELVENKYQGDDREQFRRVIRALKRWASERFSKDGNAAPRGIAITASALKWFSPGKTYDWTLGSARYVYSDLEALLGMVNSMYNACLYQSRLSASLPVPPGNDLFERMSDHQMRTFKDELAKLKSSLDFAVRQTEQQACQSLRAVFGPAFPAY